MAKRRARNERVLRGTKLNYNAGDQAQYARDIRKLVARMATETKAAVLRLFQGATAKEFYEEQKAAAAMDASVTTAAEKMLRKLTARFDQLFGKRAEPLVEKMVEQAGQSSATGLGGSLKKISGEVTLKTNFMTPALKEITKAAIVENVGLIKTISQKFLADVRNAVMQSISTGNGLKDLIPALQQSKEISLRHANNVALDQTRKVYNYVNKGRMLKVGINKFEWLHSGGGSEPRKSHMALSGQIFSFDKLPIINEEEVARGKSPVRGIPGQAINCGCTMIPVTTFDEEEAE